MLQSVWITIILTIKVKSKIAVDDILNYFWGYFSKKIKLDISCESSARQMIHMKCQVLFSLKINNRNISKFLLLQLWVTIQEVPVLRYWVMAWYYLLRLYMSQGKTFPTKQHTSQAKTQISLPRCAGWSVFAFNWKMLWLLGYRVPCKDSEPDSADAHADLSLH